MPRIYQPFFFLFLLLGLKQMTHAQSFCGTDELHRHLLRTNLTYKKAIELQNVKWAQYNKEKPVRANRPAGTEDDFYEIPVVIHVIHTGQALGSVNNPSDATLYGLIDELNQKYAATWPSYPGVGSGGVNVPIRFKLAQRTPDCQPTNGINRVNGSSLPGYSEYGIDYGGSGFGASDIAVKALSIFPNTSYLNLWIVTDIQGTTPGGSGIAGYATYPGGLPSTDGIVLDADYTSWSLTHETGHYLGLRHTFEGSTDATTCPSNIDCSNDGDLVCDTDPHPLLKDCPTGTNPCTGISYEPVVYNTMGYTFCRNRFTAGQADRMIFTLENFRKSLLTSLGGLPPGTEPVIIPPTVAACAPNGNIGNDPYWFFSTTVRLADLLVVTDTRIEEGKRSYIDHTKGSCIQAQPVAHLNPEGTYTITVITGDPNPKSVGGWIDFNNDGTFQSSELIISKATTENQTHTATFTVPSTGVVTCTSLRMRISIDYADNSQSPQPCGNIQHGQTEDFIVIVQDPAILAPSVSITANTTNLICQGTNVTFTATPVNCGNNPAYQWKLNGNNVGDNSDTYSNNTLANGDVVSCVVTSSALNNCNLTATSNSITMAVRPSVTPSIGISVSQNNICAGTSVTFTANETNGANPRLQWKLNGNDVGNGRYTYSTNTLADGDVVSCVMTSAEQCASPKTVTSNSIVMKVNATLAPSVSIAINNEGPICEGSTITFTATPANEGNNPAYQWKLNGTNVGDNSSTYSNNSLSIGDAISCVITSSAQNNCNPTATSNSIFVHFDQTVIPSVSISASETNICAGATVVFTATVTNGAYPTLQWKINGVDVEGNGYLKYTSSTLADGDVVSCEMTSDLPCANPRKATSNSIVMKVNATLAPSVSIAVNTEGPICESTNLTFTATPANGGNNPSYQWKLNGNNVGSNSKTYNATLINSDVVSCVMTSSAQNICSPTATSNSIIIWTTPSVTPSVSISASQNNICAGTNVTFIAYPVEGNEPDIKWKLNGNDVNRNSSSRYVYNTSTLADGDVVSCEMISGYPCANPKTVTSNSIVMKVNASVTPSITINASQNNICAGTNVTFTASPINGADPYLRWKVNGNEVQIGSLTYHSNTLADGDVVSCFMISEHPCASPKSAVSNNIVMKVNAGTAPSINISSSHNNICAGTMVTFTASAINAGTNPKYQWKVGNTNVGINSPTFTTTSLTNGAVVTCVLTSTSACASNGTVTSPGIAISVSSPPLATIVAGGLLTFCSGKSVPLRVSTGTGYTYQWRRSGVNIPGETSSNFTANATGIYSGVVTNAAGCSTTSLALNVTVNPVPLASVVASGPLSFCSGKSVILRVGTGTGNTYQWKKGAANIDGATQSSYTATSSGLYTVVVTNASGCIVTSATSTVVVNSLPAATITPGGPLTFCSGKNALLRANTGTGFTYQWKRAGVNIPGETSLYYTAATTGFYNVVVTNAAGCATMSAATAVVVNPLPVATITPGGPLTFCTGKNVLLRANTGTGYTYQWKKSGVIIPEWTASTYTATTTGVYTVVVTNVSGCSVTSAGVPVTVNPLPLATLVPAGPTTFCANKDVLLKAIVGAVYTYQWKRGGVNILGQTGSTHRATTTGVYSVVVTNAAGCSANSDVINVIVNPAPLATLAVGGPTTFCAGKNVPLKAIVGTGYTYQWRRSGNNIHNATSSSYSADLTGVYTVVVTNAGGCSTTSEGIDVTVNAAPPATITANGPLTFPQGGQVVLNAPAGTGFTYQWKKDGANILGATSESHPATLSGSYTVAITNSSGCLATSQPTVVSVTPGRPITKNFFEEEDLIKVYPNPLYRNDYLNIEWNITTADKGVSVTVSDISGRKIHSKFLKPFDKTLRITGASGVYIVEFRWGLNKRKIFRVVKLE